MEERQPIPGVGCCACGFVYYDARRQCWRCHKRPCSSCGKDTGSEFIELCIGCARDDTSDALPYTKPVQTERPKPAKKPQPKKGKRK